MRSSRLRFFSGVAQGATKGFALAHPNFPTIEISHDLSNCYLYTHKLPPAKKNKLVHDVLPDAFANAPFQTNVRLEKNRIHTTGLHDIWLSLEHTMAQLRAEDPFFFYQLKELQTACESDVDDHAINISKITLTPLRATYFCLQGLRAEGMQHSIELLFKACQRNNIITQQELAKLVEFTWLTSSAQRSASTAKPPAPEEDIQFVPYVFRP